MNPFLKVFFAKKFTLNSMIDIIPMSQMNNTLWNEITK